MFTGANLRFWIVTWIVSPAMAGETSARAARTVSPPIRIGMRQSLLERRRDLLGVHLVALKDLEPGLEQILQFRIGRVRNEDRLERVIDRLVIGDFVVGVGLVELRAAQFLELCALGVGLLDEGLAGV